MPTIEELGQKVKAKYPGQYDDLSDSDVGKKVKAKYPTEYSDFTEATRTAPRNSLRGGPANMPADENNPAQKGFMSSLLDAVTAPYELVRGLVSGETKLSDVPRGMLEGAGNTIVKVGSGNLAGAAGDIVGGAIVGKLAGAAGKGAAAVAPESAAAVARPVLTTASKVAKNPLARDVLGVVSPRAGKVIDAISRIKKSIEAQKATPVAPAEVPGVPPEQYYATAPATPETPAPGMAPAAGSDYLMPEPAQIPANASPAQLAQFPPQTVIDYLQGQGKPVAEPIPATPAEAATKPQVSVIPAPGPAVPREVYETAARSAKASKVADLLNKHGITAEDAALMGDPEWAQLEQAAGVKKLSAESRKVTLEQLKKLEAPKTAAEVPEVLKKNPKAAKIAMELQKEMNK